ncbi:MAG: iron-sulfur cluster assembly accessory protein [Alphaproteobacteria bacterium]|nr:iron-sulfur cluster assembly accessory protein [Alphaproteobacteria bacterium]
MLRVTVDGGGCSGFQYRLTLTEDHTSQDIIFAETVVTDDISLPFLAGSVIKFEEGLIGSEFKIENPNAKSGCGCGTSFSM